MAKRTLVANKVNSKGIHYCMTREGDFFQVWKLCENYCRHAKGGIAKTWRVVQKNISEQEAKKLFDRRAK